VRNVYWV